jgi:hypothetical protein
MRDTTHSVSTVHEDKVLHLSNEKVSPSWTALSRKSCPYDTHIAWHIFYPTLQTIMRVICRQFYELPVLDVN